MTQAARNFSFRLRRQGHHLGLQRVGLLFLLLVLAILTTSSYFIVSWLKNSNNVPISKLVITGERRFTRDNDIRQAILAQGALQTFVTQDVAFLQQQIMQRLPWVKQVSIRKEWPDKLIINISEYQPVAYWNERFFIDNRGKVFTLPSSRLTNKIMPLLFGPENQQQMVLSHYYEMNQQLKAINVQLAFVSLTPRHSWILILDNGIKIELGRQDRMLRLKRFITLYSMFVQQTPDQKRINYVDMRYKSGAAIGYTPII